jgi:hypothetical protein
MHSDAHPVQAQRLLQSFSSSTYLLTPGLLGLSPSPPTTDRAPHSPPQPSLRPDPPGRPHPIRRRTRPFLSCCGCGGCCHYSGRRRCHCLAAQSGGLARPASRPLAACPAPPLPHPRRRRRRRRLPSPPCAPMKRRPPPRPAHPAGSCRARGHPTPPRTSAPTVTSAKPSQAKPSKPSQASRQIDVQVASGLHARPPEGDREGGRADR